MARTKQAVPDVERFMNYKSIINDLYDYNGDTIRAKKTVRAAACRLMDMNWMVDEICRLPGAKAVVDVKRFTNIARQVRQIVKERHRAIAGGLFIDMSSAVFARYRFLVQELEKVILPLVDEEVVERITGEKLADEDENRVKIDLMDPDDPDDDDDDDESKLSNAVPEKPREFAKVGLSDFDFDAPPG